MTSKFLMPIAGRRLTRQVGGCACLGLALVFAGVHETAEAATHMQIEGGRSYMDNYGAHAVFAEATLSERPIGSSRFTWAPDIAAGWIDRRSIEHFQHCRYSVDKASWILAGGVRLRAGSNRDWYHPLFFSFQPALHSGTTMALSSAYQFVSTLGWQARRFSFQIRHISNGSLRGPNRGETMALVGIGFDLPRCLHAKRRASASVAHGLPLHERS